MTSLYESRLQLFQQSCNRNLLKGIRHGIEREGLRVLADATLSQKNHPGALGKTLTHPYITTDYSEALLEFITPVYYKIGDVMHFLEELHAYTCRNLEGEYLWAGSMPAKLQGEESIPVAQYGTSNSGRMKSVYREGLAHRYGKAMQAIAGIHYNFSIPSDVWKLLHDSEDRTNSLEAFQSETYLALIRNFRRYSWLLMYLFGASPAVSKSFFTKREPGSQLQELDEDTLYLPWATSLRMSDLGYNNNAQSSLSICYNTLDEYVSSLTKAIKTPYGPYEKMGVKKNGTYLQLNTNLLQIENEYYSNIRPKRIANRGQKPLTALRENGVEYVEVRCLDINPFTPLGLSGDDAHFMDVFLVYCTLMDSPAIDYEECQRVTENFTATVTEGRRPGLKLKGPEQELTLQEWGCSLLDDMMPIARLLDDANEGEEFSKAVTLQREKLNNSALTPSAQLLDALQSQQVGYVDWMMATSRQYTGSFSEVEMSEERIEYLNKLSIESEEAQLALERSDKENFERFLEGYFRSE